MKAILTYHSVDDSGSPISVAPDVFQAHLRWLTSGRIRVVGLDKLANSPESGEDVIAVTFDDGFQNTRRVVEDLAANALPVTVFVVTGHVGGTNTWGGQPARGVPTLPLLDWSDLEHLVTRGVTVAAHTRTHPPLTTVSSQALDDELLGAQDDLQRRLGVTSRDLAYPYGDVNDDVAARAGRYYRRGYTTDFNPLRSTDTLMRLPRLDMYYFAGPGALESWGTPRFARRIAWYQARRRVRAALVGRRYRSTP